ncbi:hypothetical protein IRJ41_009705 [Triplophysa rosa]|uniref:Uncharacterized protein n=1 Tax=Triplophysa rosa TaxID=992332 RepID=A0A9W7WQU3_TRIRA|nr:hypothetical protein IRJ41_009705 [Triplophysa rosa]
MVTFTTAHKYSNQRRARGRGPFGCGETEAEVPPSPRTNRSTAGSRRDRDNNHNNNNVVLCSHPPFFTDIHPLSRCLVVFVRVKRSSAPLFLPKSVVLGPDVAVRRFGTVDRLNTESSVTLT